MEKKVEKSERLPDVVRMQKDGEKKDVLPGAVESLKGLGWTVVGEGRWVDDKGNVAETATVIATPAHTFMTAEGLLKVIPENYNELIPAVPAVEKPAEAKLADKKQF